MVVANSEPLCTLCFNFILGLKPVLFVSNMLSNITIPRKIKIIIIVIIIIKFNQ